MKLLIDFPILPEALARLRAEPGLTVDCVEPPAETEARPLDPARIADVDALFCTFPPTNLGDMRALRWIQIASTGYTQLFGLGLNARGIRVTNARGCFDVPIAEWNVAMMVNLLRDFRQMIRHQDTAVWDRSARFQRELRGPDRRPLGLRRHRPRDRPAGQGAGLESPCPHSRRPRRPAR